MSDAERELVGIWACPSPFTVDDIALPSAPIPNPWHVVELNSDRSQRSWLVSADDPSRRSKVSEGRWSVVGGGLRFEDIPIGAWWMAREAATRIDAVTDRALGVDRRTLARRGLYAPFRQGRPYDVPYRLLGTGELELTYKRSPPLILSRLPGTSGRTTDPATRRARPVPMRPGTMEGNLGGPVR